MPCEEIYAENVSITNQIRSFIALSVGFLSEYKQLLFRFIAFLKDFRLEIKIYRQLCRQSRKSWAKKKLEESKYAGSSVTKTEKRWKLPVIIKWYFLENKTKENRNQEKWRLSKFQALWKGLQGIARGTKKWNRKRGSGKMKENIAKILFNLGFVLKWRNAAAWKFVKISERKINSASWSDFWQILGW